MSEITLDKLNAIENSIYEFGIKFSNLLERIRLYLNGDASVLNEKDLDLEEIMKYLEFIKEEMHKQIEEVYKDNNLSHMSKIYNDFQEQFQNLNLLGNHFKKN
jgi:hypothetical protein